MGQKPPDISLTDIQMANKHEKIPHHMSTGKCKLKQVTATHLSPTYKEDWECSFIAYYTASLGKIRYWFP